MDGRGRLTIVAIGCALLAAGVAATLAHAVPERTGTNDVLVTSVLGETAGRVVLCQNGERVPSGTGAVRVSFDAAGRRGPPLAVAVAAGSGTIARGTLAAGWSADAATVALRPVVRAGRSARVCVTIGASGVVALRGEPSEAANTAPPATANGKPLEGRVRLDYLTPQPRTWWSQVGAIARHMGYGHALGGASVAVLTALLTLGAAALGLWQLARSER